MPVCVCNLVNRTELRVEVFPISDTTPCLISSFEIIAVTQFGFPHNLVILVTNAILWISSLRALKFFSCSTAR